MDYYKQGYEHGKKSGSWVTDGNTKTETYAWILKGFDEGNPEVMDIQPNPLSGERAGESISELLGLEVGEEVPDDESLAEYEQGFSDGFWEQVISDCNYQLNNN